ncbi:hypothetical protein GCM10010195_67370 [Kitasatospora griseola]|nr:hypothetical protein GCM10010195_67370 [Kitasatospora griseola]
MEVAGLLGAQGRTAEAIQTVRARTALGHRYAPEHYAVPLARHGHAQGALDLLLPHAGEDGQIGAPVDIAHAAGRDRPAGGLAGLA